ncbi:MAG: PQQ-binding-like beta-propeller repeat protein [Gemmataceae bacterium]
MRCSLFLLFCFSTGISAGETWPQFRGPQGAGHSDATGLPVKWTEKENVVWKTAIHDKGWSSPVVWGQQIWMTTAREDGKEMFAVCVARDSGKILYDLKIFDVEKPAFCIAFNSYASPSPVIEEGRVYVHFGTYGTACLDTATGKKIWERRDLNCNHHRGPGSSPILFDDLLIVNFDGFDVQYVVALDKKTGKTVWKKDRNIAYDRDDGDIKKAYGTPAVFAVDGKPQLVSPSAGATIAYDPRTGDELWRINHGGMNASAPPLYQDGQVFIATSDGGFRLLAARHDGHGDVTKTHVDWKYNKAVPSRTSPLLIDDKLVMINEQGILSCLTAKTGQLVWQERVGGQYIASPLYADGKLYLFGQEGNSLVGEPGGKAWKLLASNNLDAGCMATPAIAGKAIFIRTKTHLYRIEHQD